MTILTAGSHMNVADKRLTASPFTDTPYASNCGRGSDPLIVS